MECCAMQTESKFSSVYDLAIYRVPTGGVEQLIRKSDCIIEYVYNPRAEFIICGYVNMIFLLKVARSNV
jgi:hypothetical protein